MDIKSAISITLDIFNSHTLLLDPQLSLEYMPCLYYNSHGVTFIKFGNANHFQPSAVHEVETVAHPIHRNCHHRSESSSDIPFLSFPDTFCLYGLRSPPVYRSCGDVIVTGIGRISPPAWRYQWQRLLLPSSCRR